MKGISVIVPFVNEWPQISWTLQAIHQEFDEAFPHEVIAVDNQCKQAEAFGCDRGHAHIKSMADKNEWLVHLPYNEKLSHWQSKNAGAAAAKYETLFLCDAHVLPSQHSLLQMFLYFLDKFDQSAGTLHMTLTYHILETERLIYRIVDDREKWGLLGYTFHPALKNKVEPYEVPVMSTCGMMVSKELFEKEMIWPKVFGIYGGGENYFNYAMAMKGYKKFIFPTGTLFHHGDKRGYRYNLPDFARNRTAAMRIVCGKDIAEKLLATHQDFRQLPEVTKERLLAEVVQRTQQDRQQLLTRATVDLEEFLHNW